MRLLTLALPVHRAERVRQAAGVVRQRPVCAAGRSRHTTILRNASSVTAEAWGVSMRASLVEDVRTG